MENSDALSPLELEGGASPGALAAVSPPDCTSHALPSFIQQKISSYNKAGFEEESSAVGEARRGSKYEKRQLYYSVRIGVTGGAQGSTEGP